VGYTGRVPFPADATDFEHSFRIKTGSEAHPAFYTMGRGYSLPEVKVIRA
jgi:hypothetical protein